MPQMKVIEMQGNLGGFTLLKAAVPEGHCPECVHPHAPEQPHNQQSLQWQYRFREKHGRWPTWHDAMRHCSDAVKEHWLRSLKAMNVEVGEDPLTSGRDELAALLKEGVRGLSVRQPYAWLIAHGHKPFENRDWSENNPGLLWLKMQLQQHGTLKLLIHAAKAMTHVEYDLGNVNAADHHVTLPPRDQLERGGIVGVATVKQWHRKRPSLPFAFGSGIELCAAKPLPFTACRGALGFFKPQIA